MLRSLFAATVLLTLACPTWSAEPAVRPNIILMLADDLGYECLRCNGSDQYETPHLDKLATGGMRFDRCYAQPLCTPTRIQLMTGRYNVRNYTNFGELKRTETTFAQLLKPAGYTTGIFGKWQLGRETDSPQHFGFDVSRLWQQTRRPSRYPNPGLEFNGVEKDFTNGEFGPDVVNDEVLKFIDDNKARPFLLYYPMILVHNPFVPTPDEADYDPKATDEKAGQDDRHFAHMIRHMDKHVGQVVAKLEQHGLREKTLVLFVGDNGTNGQITSRFRGRDYKGAKGQSKTAGMHVPFIANWPGAIKPASVNENLVDTTDFLPTLLEVANIAPPTSSELDGHSLLPELRGQTGAPRKWVYSWHPTPAREFAADRTHKLYAGGQFVEYASDSHKEQDVATNEAVQSRAALQKVLDRYAAARPAELKAKDGKGYQDGMPEAPMNRRARKKAQ